MKILLLRENTLHNNEDSLKKCMWRCLKVHAHPIKRLVLFFFYYPLRQVQWKFSKCYQQRNLLPFKNWHYPTIAVSSPLLLLPNPNSDPLAQLRAQLINWPCIVVKETNSVHCRIPNKEKGQLMLKRSELLTDFQARKFFFFGLTAHGMWEFPDQGTKPHTLQCKVFLTTEPPGKPRQRFVKATLGLRVIGCLLSWWTFFCLLGGKVTRWCLGNLNHQHLWF